MVHFEGPWAEEERQEVISAVLMFERHHRGYTIPDGVTPWVCVANIVGGRPVYTATRLGYAKVLVGRSVDDLVRALCIACATRPARHHVRPTL